MFLPAPHPRKNAACVPAAASSSPPVAAAPSLSDGRLGGAPRGFPLTCPRSPQEEAAAAPPVSWQGQPRGGAPPLPSGGQRSRDAGPQPPPLRRPLPSGGPAGVTLLPAQERAPFRAAAGAVSRGPPGRQVRGALRLHAAKGGSLPGAGLGARPRRRCCGGCAAPPSPPRPHLCSPLPPSFAHWSV